MQIKLLIFMLVSILLGSPYILAEEGCPFPKKYIEHYLNIEFGNDLVLVCVDADLRIGFDPSSAHETESHVTQIHKSPLISSKVYIQNNTTLSDFRQRIYDSIGIHMP